MNITSLKQTSKKFKSSLFKFESSIQNRIFTYNFSTTTTDADPGNGIIRYNNITINSVNTIFIDNVDQLGNTQTTWYSTWDDSTTTTARGVLTLYSRDSGTVVNQFQVTLNRAI